MSTRTPEAVLRHRQLAPTPPPQYLRFWGLGGTQDGHPNRLLLVQGPPSEKAYCTLSVLSDTCWVAVLSHVTHVFRAVCAHIRLLLKW